MALSSERVMPVIECRYEELAHRWLVDLPHGLTLPARDIAEAEYLISKHAPGSALRPIRYPSGTPAHPSAAS